jgi:WD40 repeat protein
MTQGENKEKDNPFPGLRPFEETEAHRFFGREAQIEELEEKLNQHRFVAVVGASGSGKSSLLRAGLLPRLRSSEQDNFSWKIAVLRPGNNPIKQLATALNQPDVLGASKEEYVDLIEEVIETTLRLGNLGLIELAEIRLAENSKLLVVVDQFEELFRYRSDPKINEAVDESAGFVKLLIESAKCLRVQIYILLTMRSDYIGDCAQFRDLPEMVNLGLYLVPRMTRNQLKQAIYEPIHRTGAKISNRLVNQLLNDISNQSEGNTDQLPILQHALMRTWNFWEETQPSYYWSYQRQQLIRHPEWKNWEPIDLAAYEKTGGMESALSKHANEIYENLPDVESQRVAKILFQRLTEVGADSEKSIRHPNDFQDICQVSGASEEQVKLVINAFRAPGCSFLTPFLPHKISGDTKLDISHESLIRKWDRLKAWVIEEGEAAKTYERLADIVLRQENREAELLTGRDLEVALKWQESFQPSSVWAKRYAGDYTKVEKFLKASERAKRNKNLFTWGAGSLIALGVALGCITWLRIKSSEMLIHSAAAETSFSSNQQIEALIESLRAGQALKHSMFVDQTTKLRVLTVLRQMVYGIRERNRLEHDAEVNTVAISPDGKTIATASSNQISLWDSSGKLLLTNNEHKKTVRSVNFSPDNKWLVSSDEAGEIRLWNRNAKKSKVLGQNKSQVHYVEFSPNSQAIASASSDKTAKLWNLQGDILRILPHPDVVNRMKFSSDSQIIATAGADGVVRLWRLKDKQSFRSKVISQDQVEDIVFIPDRQEIVAASADGAIYRWNFNKTENLEPIGNHGAAINSLKITPDAQMLVTASNDRTIKLWNIDGNAGKSWHTFHGHKDAILSVALSPDGQTMASASNDKTVKLWSLEGKDAFTVLPGTRPGKPIRTIDFSADGEKLVWAGDEQAIAIWHFDSDKEAPVYLGQPEKRVYSIAFSPDSKKVASTDGMNIKLWHLEESNSNIFSNIASGHEAPIYSIQFSPDGQLIASASADTTIKLWALEGKTSQTLRGHTNAVNNAKFSTDGKLLISGGDDKTIRKWNLSNGQEVKPPITGHLDIVNDILFSPDPQLLASASEDKTIKLWSWKSGIKLNSLSSMASPLSIDFSPDGQLLASSNNDGTITIWNRDGQLLNSFEGIGGRILKVKFRPRSEMLVSSDEYGQVVLWKLSLHDLLDIACHQIGDYIKNHPEVSKDNSDLCN